MPQSVIIGPPPSPAPEIGERPAERRQPWRLLAPPAVAVVIALLPAPAGLPQHAWYYFALFAGTLTGLIVEPLPGAAIGLAAVILAALLSPWLLYSPQQLAVPGFRAADAAIAWALSGFSNSGVWLILGAFILAQGYEESGLGRRIALHMMRAMGRKTLALGYAIVGVGSVLALLMPSNTARTAGTVYPIIRNLPPLYDSYPDDPSARRIGSYLMWTAVSASCVSCSLFLTANVPSLLSVEIVKGMTGLDIGWGDWFLAAAPFSLVLLLALPLLVYRLYPPAISAGDEAPQWAKYELSRLGRFSRREAVFAGLVLLGLALWLFAGTVVNVTTATILLVVLMLVGRVLTWHGILANLQALSTMVWFATLITLADGLVKVGFIGWLAGLVSTHLAGLPPMAALVMLLAFYFFSHYMFASVTAHATVLLPVALSIGLAIPGMPARPLALALMLMLGLMGVLTPYAHGPGPIFFGSGYLPARDYWRLGLTFGVIFFLAFIGLCVPYLFYVLG